MVHDSVFICLVVNSCVTVIQLFRKKLIKVQSPDIACANFCGINSPIMANFNLSNAVIETWSWEKCGQLAFTSQDELGPEQCFHLL